MYLRSSLDQEKLLNMAVSTENETNEEFDLIKKLKKQKQKLSMEGALGIDESNPGTIQNIKE